MNDPYPSPITVAAVEFNEMTLDDIALAISRWLALDGKNAEAILSITINFMRPPRYQWTYGGWRAIVAYDPERIDVPF